MTARRLLVSHSQIAVFNAETAMPFNNWTDRHVQQGFSWREGSVSFKTLVESGESDVEFSRRPSYIPRHPSAVRAISVPFACLGGGIEVATITDSERFGLNPGDYQLVFETGWGEVGCWCRFTFVFQGDLHPRLIVADRELAPCFPLLMSADPA